MDKKFFISPPFGNYIKLPYTIPIRGSFTLHERKGKWTQILKTLRYNSIYNGWTNKIGLRNPGIDYAIKTYKKGEIISIAILEKDEIKKIHDKIPNNMDIELNVSCPNTEHFPVSKELNIFLNSQRKWCIIKLSPFSTRKEVDDFYKQGFRQFHCCNTIPIKEGGLSGKAIQPFSFNLISYIKRHYPDDTIIIAGGGIDSNNDLKLYKKYGANYFSISTLCFNPIKFGIFYYRNIFNSNNSS